MVKVVQMVQNISAHLVFHLSGPMSPTAAYSCPQAQVTYADPQNTSWICSLLLEQSCLICIKILRATGVSFVCFFPRLRPGPRS